jgi:hypothetical protein
MKVAIMQPYFFPYLGYFQLIHAVDRFILGDDVQYIYQGWINRNRILKPDKEGFSFIMVPLVKHSHTTPIKNIHAVTGEEWKQKILRQIAHYKKAPFFAGVQALLKECFAISDTNIVSINAHCLKTVCQYIGIDYTIEIQSKMNFDYRNVQGRGDRPVRMCEQLGATEYINPAGGTELYSKSDFEKCGMQLHFLQTSLKPYNQNRPTFEPGLSIIDVMMFNSPADIRLMLNQYQLL